jgi:hypothetical protein
MKNYLTSKKFSGKTEAAISSIETTLLPNNFKVTKTTQTTIELTGPGLRSTKENPIRGASEIKIEARNGKLHLEASLCGIRFLAIFVIAFPFLLMATLAFLPVILAGGDFSEFNPFILLIMAPWVFISPMAVVWMRKRTMRALDDMLDNAVVLGERGRG